MRRSLDKIQTIHAEFRERILDGSLAEGERLPTTKDIAKSFDCSVGMAGKAIAMLIHEGLVVQRPGMGTRVIKAASGSDQAITGLEALAFIYPSEKHEGILRTVMGFQEAAHDAGRRVVVLTTGTDYRKEAEFVGRLSEFDVRGAVIYPVITNPQEQIHLSKMLVNSKFPMVLAEVNLPGLGCPAVVIDGYHAGQTMTRHMISRGARQIGFFSNYAWAPFMRDRYQGYRTALDEAGLTEPEAGVYLDTSMQPDYGNPLATTKRMAEDFLKRAGALDAVVCADDFLALACIAAAKNLGLETSRKMLVSGMDDYQSLAKSEGVSLTTYRIPFEEMGRKAFEVLAASLDGKSSLRGEYQIRGTLVIRESA